MREGSVKPGLAVLCVLSVFVLPLNGQDGGLSRSVPERTITAFSISMLGEPGYPDGFSHFDYVNPDAPKGGSLTLATIGTYDNFHRYALRGSCAAGWVYFYDTLMAASLDESGVYYPLVAEKIEYAEDYSFFILYINPEARDQEGEPITAFDAAFSFTIIYEKGVPFFKTRFEGVRVSVLDKGRVRFDLPVSGDKEMMVDLCTLPVFPRRFWENHDFSEPLLVPPLGTGAYRVREYGMGQYVVLERVRDYWAKDLPVNRGSYNFDTIRYDYYRDANVAFEAFKAGEYDLRVENVAMNWAVNYTGKLIEEGRILREEIPHEIPQNMQAFVFNIQRPMFQDRRVRMALNYLMDFEWMNKNLFYGQYTRTRSYFQNTEYEARSLPGEDELAILAPIQDLVAPELFTREYQPPVSDGSGFIRSQMREALALFNEAGWELRQGRMVRRDTGEQMAFELLIYDVSSERIAVPLQRNLERYGINMRIRQVDVSQYVNRLRSRDFDIINEGYDANYFPDSGLLQRWHSSMVDSTWNTAGVVDTAVDYLVEGILDHQGDKEALLAWGRALDRVLTWNHYVIPQWHLAKFRLAYADKFGRPEVRPRYDVGLDTWWIR
jgi:microcin C transport system substrate-binding protein